MKKWAVTTIGILFGAAFIALMQQPVVTQQISRIFGTYNGNAIALQGDSAGALKIAFSGTSPYGIFNTLFETHLIPAPLYVTVDCVGGVSGVRVTKYFRVVALDQSYRQSAASEMVSVVDCPQDGHASLEWQRAPGQYGTGIYASSSAGGPWEQTGYYWDSFAIIASIGLSTGMAAPNIVDSFYAGDPPPTVGAAYSMFYDFPNGVFFMGGQAEAGRLIVRQELMVPVGATITGPDAGNWNQAYGWGDHAQAGYLDTPGAWTTVSHTAGDFTGSGSMTWTVDAGDLDHFAYTIMGKTMVLALNVITSSVGGTPATLLLVKIPGGYKAKAGQKCAYESNDNGTRQIGTAFTAAASALISLRVTANTSTAWAAATNTTDVSFTCTFEIE
jgi:hypothetical protein